ncbi:MAG: S8 family peptidase [Bacteroidota bacterium]
MVATNASFGVEGATCSDFNVWGGLYDELGRAGILTAASTANRNWDVDMFGDMPTDCPSEYLIGVANIGPNDLLWRSSGFGRQSVDLGAPGEESFSTLPGSRYGTFGSTSAAAPYVTGAIALLYATPCAALLNEARQDPAGAALRIRSVLLSSTTDNASLAFRTVTGGALNVAEAQRRLAENCSLDTPTAFSITEVRPNPTADEVVLTTSAIVFGESGRIDLFDATGRFVRSQGAERIGTNPIRLRADLRGLPAGLYVLRLTERDRTTLTQVVKQ